jgi:hypothetical protein
MCAMDCQFRSSSDLLDYTRRSVALRRRALRVLVENELSHERVWYTTPAFGRFDDELSTGRADLCRDIHDACSDVPFARVIKATLQRIDCAADEDTHECASTGSWPRQPLGSQKTRMSRASRKSAACEIRRP